MTDAPNTSGETPGDVTPARDYAPLPQLPKKQPKRQRPHVRQTRYSDDEVAEFGRRAREAGLSDGAYTRQATIGAAGPRARRRLPVDHAALMQALAAFAREHNNYNQAVRALNTLALVAHERDSDRLVQEIRQLQLQVEALQEQFRAPLAAIHEATRRDRER